MVEIIPNWHPMLVNFTVTLLIITGVLQLINWLSRSDSERTTILVVQKWMVLVSSLSVIATVATGLYAYYTVAHDTPSHVAMTNHRNWALTTTAIFLAGAVLYFALPRLRQTLAGTCFVAALVLVSITGYKGGELVYRHGLGVMSLPQVTDKGHDHGHEHDNDHDDEHDDDHDNDHDDGHDNGDDELTMGMTMTMTTR